MSKILLIEDDAKIRAMKAHSTQIEVDGPFFALSNHVGNEVWGYECYRLAKGRKGPAYAYRQYKEGYGLETFAGPCFHTAEWPQERWGEPWSGTPRCAAIVNGELRLTISLEVAGLRAWARGAPGHDDDHDREESRGQAAIRVREDVVGVQVTQPDEDVDHLVFNN